MKRYGICPITGNGTFQDPYRATVQDLNATIQINSTALIPSKQDGSPKYGFAFFLCSTPSLPAVQLLLNTLVFPDHALDSRMDAMQAQTRANLVADIESYDLDGEGLHLVADHDDADSYRDLLIAIGQQFDAAFNINAFDVAEVSA